MVYDHTRCKENFLGVLNKHPELNSRLYKKERKKYFDTLEVNKITDN